MNTKFAIAFVILGALVAGGAGFWLGRANKDEAILVSTAEATAAPTQSGAKKILYYRNPMGLPDTSVVPKKDWMGMDYIPVYEGEEASADDGTVKVSLAKVQKLGVRTETAARRMLMRPIRATGTIQLDERRQAEVTVRAEGWIEKLFVRSNSEPVRKDQPLFELYAPRLVQAQEDYLVALKYLDEARTGDGAARGHAERVIEAALRRLRNLGVSDSQIARLQSERVAQQRVTIGSPISGFVQERKAVEGMHVNAGDAIFRIADDSSVWLIAEVFEQDLGLVRLGQSISVTVNAYSDRTFEGRLSFIYPMLKNETRTARVRIDVPNPKGLLKADMYASVVLNAEASAVQFVAVPESAVLDSGTRQTVLVERKSGEFEPRAVKVGQRADGWIEIREGVSEGERVVVSANFLIDAEANLRAALKSFTAEEKPQ